MRERRARRRYDARAGHQLFQESAPGTAEDEDMPEENRLGYGQVSVRVTRRPDET